MLTDRAQLCAVGLSVTLSEAACSFTVLWPFPSTLQESNTALTIIIEAMLDDCPKDVGVRDQFGGGWPDLALEPPVLLRKYTIEPSSKVLASQSMHPARGVMQQWAGAADLSPINMWATLPWSAIFNNPLLPNIVK